MAEAFVFDLDNRYHFAETVLDRMLVCVTEAVNNGIVHGNNIDPSKFVDLDCTCYDDRVVFVVHDQGNGFLKENLADPLAEENLLKESGRGILIIEHLMDAVEYHRTDAGMNVKMTIYTR